MQKIKAWQRFREVLDGGEKFITKHLKKFSDTENQVDFNNRRAIAYCPAHAEAILIEIKNSIYQRMADVTRTNGPDSFQEAITGEDGIGVDLFGNSMTDFMGESVILELLALGRVGIWVDKPKVEQGSSRADAQRPYVYIYATENILSWSIVKGKIKSVLLREFQAVTTDENLTKTMAEVYRLARVTEDGVQIDFYNKKGELLPNDSVTLELDEIPLVIGQISHSILKNIDGYQIALLNLASSDLNYAMKSNFTFYTEQFDPIAELTAMRQALAKPDDDNLTNPDKNASETEALIAAMKQIQVGVAKGRRYARGLERPGFISPSSEPLEASMIKQDKMRKEIRELANLNVSSLEPRRESAEAKKFNERTLESGLSYIGMELQYIERRIAYHWSRYDDETELTTIKYPRDYSLKTDPQRAEEADGLRKRGTTISSITYQKHIAKEIVRLELGNKVTAKELNQIYKDIDDSVVPFCDAEIISTDIESRVLSSATGSKIRLYPEGEAQKALSEHAERSASILDAQEKKRGTGDPAEEPAARGVPDLDTKE